MRLMRIEHQGDPYFAEWMDDATARLWTAAPWLGGEATDRLVPLGRTKRLPPVKPDKILCVGRNYAAHAKEMGNEVPAEPLLFLKANSSLLAHGEHIHLPLQSQQVEHEGEIGIVIGEALKNADRKQARAAIYGVTAVNDVTARDIQRADTQFTRGKSFDTFCPVGPWIDTELALDPLTVVTRVNGEVRQQGSASDMVFPIVDLLVYMSAQMTLHPGDLIATGTPEGVGPLQPGDRVEVEVRGLPALCNTVVGAQD